MRLSPALALLALCLLSSCPPAQQAINADSGDPDAVLVGDKVKRLPNGGRPGEKIPFPAITDWNSLKITLDRSGCYGTCPTYTVSIGGDGAVLYEGEKFVAVRGTHRTSIDVETVRTLYAQFTKADFFWAFDTYDSTIFDAPIYHVSIAYDEYGKTILDNRGSLIGMPPEIIALEKAIDDAGETAKWVRGNDATIRSLEAEHWNPHATDDKTLELLESASLRGNWGLLRSLLDAGVDPRNRFGCGALEWAGWHHRPDEFVLLLDKGAPTQWALATGDTAPSCDAVWAAVKSGIPGLVERVLAQRPDVNRTGPDNATLLMEAAGGFSDEERPDVNFAAVVKLLLAAGADPNLRDAQGKTALMHAFSPAAAQALLEGGADPWLTDRNGRNAYEALRQYDKTSAAVIKSWMDSHPNARHAASGQQPG